MAWRPAGRGALKLFAPAGVFALGSDAGADAGVERGLARESAPANGGCGGGAGAAPPRAARR